MTSAQTAKYFHEWGRVRDVLLSRGLSHAQADARRHELHAKALGRDKSSKDFTNGDLDKVLAVFLAQTEGGNLDAQLRLLDQPGERAGRAVARIGVLRDYLGLKPGLAASYVAGIARNLWGEAAAQYHKLDDVRLARLEGVIVAALRRKHSAERVAEILREAEEAARAQVRPVMAAAGAEEEEPF